jgi:hypothetical protein
MTKVAKKEIRGVMCLEALDAYMTTQGLTATEV